MKINFFVVVALALSASVFTLPAWALTDIYLALDDGGTGFTGPHLFHVTYDNNALPVKTYSVFGAQPLGAGTTINSLAVNSNQGASGGIYAAMSGAFNQLAEYSFNHGTGVFGVERANAGVFGDIAVDGLDRLYVVETATTGALQHLVPHASLPQFDVNATVDTANEGGDAYLAILNNNDVVVSGRRRTTNPTDFPNGFEPNFSFQYRLTGSSLNLQAQNNNGAIIPADLAVLPNGKLIIANQNRPLTPFNSLYEMVVPLTNDGGDVCCGINALGATIVWDDIDVLSDGTIIATGASDFFTGSPEQYLISHRRSGINLTTTGLIQIGVLNNMMAEPSVITVDENDIIHVSSGGRLVAWDLAPDPMNPGFDKFTAQACFPNDCVSFNAVGTGTAIVSAVAPAVVSLPGDFNGDGMVDAADFLAWRSSFGTASGATLADGDANVDGDVDGGDFLVWQQNFGPAPLSSAQSASVPESTTILLGACCLAAILPCRVRRPC